MTPLPPKQGLKRDCGENHRRAGGEVMTPLPPKQGLKPGCDGRGHGIYQSYDTTSTKTRIETRQRRQQMCDLTLL